jgi:RND family efflux transporter MFP subunit
MSNSTSKILIAAVVIALCLSFDACSPHDTVTAAEMPTVAPEVTVGVVPVTTRVMAQHLTLSSELVPFQEIDVYAKEAGYVKELYVDYGNHVKKGQLMAVLEIPELEAQLVQDDASVAAHADQVIREEHEVGRVKAQSDVAHLQFQRLDDVAKTKAGLVAQQEVDDAQGKDLAAQSQLDAVRGGLAAAQSELAESKAKKAHDEALYAYSRITAPFDGIITQRFANLGALMQAGTTSTQATPLVRLSEEDLFRLVIPVPESSVRYIRTGDSVDVRVPSLDRHFVGRVSRFSVDVSSSTRTMHTEVDVQNTDSRLVPGLYAEAMLTLNQKSDAVVVPLQALNHEGEQTTVYVVDSSGKLEDKKVALGIQTPDFAEISSGVSKGEQVVVSDRSGLKPGQVVKAKRVEDVSYKEEQ